VEKRARVTNALLKDAEKIAELVNQAAQDGDATAQALILSRTVPILKAEGERVEFTFDSSASQVEQVEQVLQAISDGLVPVDTGKQIIDAISQLASVRQVEELEARIKALEDHR